MSTKQIKNITNQRFGRLVVSAFVEIRKSKTYWLCYCDCGTKKIVEGYNLKHGITKSCGCLQREVAAINAKLKRGTKRAKITGNKMQCSNCKKYKLFKEFPNAGNQCKVCRKEYNQRPEIKAKKRISDKKYRESETGKAKTKEYKKEYNQRPEVKKSKKIFSRKYRKTEKGKTAQRQYLEQPEIKKRNKKRLKILNKKRIGGLTGSYVRNKIVTMFKNIGLKPKDVTPEMIKIKRDLLLFYREAKNLRNRLS